MKSSLPSLLTLGWLLACPSLAPAQIPPPVIDASSSRDLLARRGAILARERERLTAVGDPGLAEAEAPASSDGPTRFVPLAEVVVALPKKGLANVEVDRAKGDPAKPGRDAIRTEAAQALFELAGQAARATSTEFAFADACLRDVLERLPDHPEARRLLGFLPRSGGWATPYAAGQLAQGKVSDPTFGWVPGDWVPHLRRGELPGRPSNRWLPAAEADELRRNWADGWDITTEHFSIHTDVPLAEAISFGRKLENLHQLFFSMMADVIGPEQLPLAQRYRVASLKPTVSKKPPHRVYYFANRDEYAEHLAPFQGEGSKLSLGTYLPKKENVHFGGISYFFKDVAGQIDVTSTLYHEASHQLLFESAGPDDYLRNVGNFWVFEGLGTYFETLQVEPDGSLRIGGMVGPRIAQARTRLVDRGEFIPIEPFVALNLARFQGTQGGGDIYLHYAESMALALFLMQAHDGRYREGFLDYVRDAYKGRFRGGSGRTLEDRVGVRYQDLDREFLAYLSAKPRIRRAGPPNRDRGNPDGVR